MGIRIYIIHVTSIFEEKNVLDVILELSFFASFFCTNYAECYKAIDSRDLQCVVFVRGILPTSSDIVLLECSYHFSAVQRAVISALERFREIIPVQKQPIDIGNNYVRIRQPRTKPISKLLL